MEKADLEAERVTLFESVIQNQRSMKEFESNLLHKLSSIQVKYRSINDVRSVMRNSYVSFRVRWLTTRT